MILWENKKDIFKKFLHCEISLRSAVFYAVISAFIFGIIYDYGSYLWVGGLVAMIPLFFIIDHVKKDSWWHLFLVGWSFGTIFIGTVLVWFWSTLPLNWIGINNNVFGIVIVFIVWSLLTVPLAIFIGLFAILFRRFRKGFVRAFIIAPIAWILFEYARTFGFYLFSLGPGSNFGPHFTMGFLGYLLANNTQLLALSVWGDVYILSLLVVLVNGVLYEVLTNAYPLRKKILVFSTIILILITLTTTPVISFIQGSQKPIQKMYVAVLHTSTNPYIAISQSIFNARIATLKNLVIQSSINGKTPDIVILPEDSRFLITLIQQGNIHSFFNKVFHGREVLIIGSSRVTSRKGKVHQRMFAYNTKTESIQTEEKMFLLPYGEYMPYFYTALLNLLGRSNIVAALSRNRSYSIGSSANPIRFENILVGSLFCSDVITPVFYHELTVKGANILVNIASESWFHHSRILNRQIINIAEVRAAANNRYYVQASDSSPSFIINNKGGIEAKSKSKGNSLLYKEVSLYR